MPRHKPNPAKPAAANPRLRRRSGSQAAKARQAEQHAAFNEKKLFAIFAKVDGPVWPLRQCVKATLKGKFSIEQYDGDDVLIVPLDQPLPVGDVHIGFDTRSKALVIVPKEEPEPAAEPAPGASSGAAASASVAPPPAVTAPAPAVTAPVAPPPPSAPSAPATAASASAPSAPEGGGNGDGNGGGSTIDADSLGEEGGGGEGEGSGEG